jgi:hypothetical protein
MVQFALGAFLMGFFGQVLGWAFHDSSPKHPLDFPVDFGMFIGWHSMLWFAVAFVFCDTLTDIPFVVTLCNVLAVSLVSAWVVLGFIGTLRIVRNLIDLLSYVILSTWEFRNDRTPP